MIPSPAFRARRPLIALLCASLVLSACGATEPQAAGRNDAAVAATATRWPAPAVQATDAATPARRIEPAMPNFEAPSAKHCARPIRTSETPGSGGSARHRSALGAVGAPAAMPAPVAPGMAPPAMPTPPLASMAAPMASAPSAAPMAEARASAKMARSAIVESAPAAVPPPLAAAAPRDARAAAVAQRPAHEPVTAGMVDDNADFGEYLAFRNRTQVAHRERDISERYLLQVRDAQGSVVPDAEVAVQAANGAAMWARTDAGGRAWLHPKAFDAEPSPVYEVTVRKNGRQATSFLRRGQKNAVDVVLERPGARPARAQLDLVFLIDATGSMGDEIARLRSTLRDIADQVARLPSRPDTCFGLVAYRDLHDEFVVRRHDFTNDLDAFQGVLDALQAAGGGDYPEAMNEALHETVQRLSWRGDDTTRLVMLLADAPPHLDYLGPQYDDSMVAALGKGIKVLSVGASGLDKQGEYIQRQIAQYTGGRFVFLTYRNAADPASGPGTQTVHDVGNYSVQTLDKLVVRLVSEELGKLPGAQASRGG